MDRVFPNVYMSSHDILSAILRCLWYSHHGRLSVTDKAFLQFPRFINACDMMRRHRRRPFELSLSLFLSLSLSLSLSLPFFLSFVDPESCVSLLLIARVPARV